MDSQVFTIRQNDDSPGCSEHGRFAIARSKSAPNTRPCAIRPRVFPMILARTFFQERTGALHRICARQTQEEPWITEDTTKGSKKDEDGQNEGAVKETKTFRGRISWRSTPANGLRLETRGKTPAVVSESHKLAIPGCPRHLRTHTCKRTLARSRALPLVGGQSGYKARRKRDECRGEP